MVTGQAVLACFPVELVLVVSCQLLEPHEIPAWDCAQHRRASHHSGKSWKICLYLYRARVGHSSLRLPGLKDMCHLEQRHIHTFLTSHQKIQLSLSAWSCSARLSHSLTFPCLKTLLWRFKVHQLSLERTANQWEMSSHTAAVWQMTWWHVCETGTVLCPCCAVTGAAMFSSGSPMVTMGWQCPCQLGSSYSVWELRGRDTLSPTLPTRSAPAQDEEAAEKLVWTIMGCGESAHRIRWLFM